MRKKPNPNQRNLPERASEKSVILARRKQYLIGILALLTLVTASVVTVERNQKRIELIMKLLREHFRPVCEQYALTARDAQYFPCFGCENGKIFLQEGEVWRYGFAGEGGEKARYPGKIFYQDENWILTIDDLEYETQYRGTKLQCLISEINKIIDYPDLPEARIREIKLIRPPGNKQDR